MAARRIKGSPMKYWGFYVSEELKADTIKHAEQLNVPDSEYIRMAVESYNAQQMNNVSASLARICGTDKECIPKCDSCFYVGCLSDTCNKCDGYVYYKPKNDKSKPNMVHQQLKGGK